MTKETEVAATAVRDSIPLDDASCLVEVSIVNVADFWGFAPGRVTMLTPTEPDRYDFEIKPRAD